MIVLRKLLFSFFIFFIVVVIFLFSSSEILASFSFSITDADPPLIDSKNQEISVNLSITELPTGDSYFRVGIQKGNSFIGYIKNNNGDWVKLKSLSEDKTNQSCQNYFKVNENPSFLKLFLKVGEDNEIENGNYYLKAHRFTSTCGSYMISNETNPVFLTVALPTLTPTPTPTKQPTSTSAPSSTPTPTSKPPTPKAIATYKINEVKDEDGEILSNVKVYVDNVYIHHYAPEVLTFCDGCQCDTYVDCGFGQHTIKLEKTGYEDWSKEITINSNVSDEVSPVMVFLESSPTSTPIPTPKILTPTPSQKISPTPTPKKSNQTATGSGEILGEETATFSAFYPYEATSESEKNEATPSAENKIIPKIFLVGGLLLLFASACWLWYNFKYTS